MTDRLAEIIEETIEWWNTDVDAWAEAWDERCQAKHSEEACNVVPFVYLVAIVFTATIVITFFGRR